MKSNETGSKHIGSKEKLNKNTKDEQRRISHYHRDILIGSNPLTNDQRMNHYRHSLTRKGDVMYESKMRHKQPYLESVDIAIQRHHSQLRPRSNFT